MRILGLDPGSIATGYGVVERRGSQLVHVAHGTLRSPRSGALPDRLAFLYREIARIVAEHQPVLAAVERCFAGRSVRSALVLGQARGVALAAIAAGGIPITELAPQQVKLAVTGNGSAEKQQVQAMVRRLLALATVPPRDAADALGAAIAIAFRGRLGALSIHDAAPRPRTAARQHESAGIELSLAASRVRTRTSRLIVRTVR
jgi:crossover junction endodeoxyribonuclease RuvC